MAPAQSTSGWFRSAVQHPLFAKGTLALVTLVGIGFFAARFFVKAEVEPPRPLATSPVERELVAVLDELRGAWEPRQRVKILSAAPGNAEKFAGPLDRLLRLGEHALLQVAAEYAGAMGVPELRASLAELASSATPKARAAAILAAEKLEPWAAEQLAKFLAVDEHAAVQTAALQLCTPRDDAPWEAMFGLHLARDERVRRAAVEATPTRLPREALRQLWSLVQRGSAEQAAVSIEAIVRTDWDAAHELAAAQALQRPEPAVQLAALEVLCRKGAPLEVRKEIWALTLDINVEPAVRAKAMQCIEQTESYDLDSARGALHGTDPLVRYFAARCLIRAGDQDGPLALLDLLQGNDGEAATLARQLLAALTGLGPTSRPEVFLRALRDEDAHWRHRGALPASGISF